MIIDVYRLLTVCLGCFGCYVCCLPDSCTHHIRSLLSLAYFPGMEMEVSRVKYWTQGHLIISGRNLIWTLEPVLNLYTCIFCKIIILEKLVLQRIISYLLAPKSSDFSNQLAIYSQNRKWCKQWIKTQISLWILHSPIFNSYCTYRL